MTAPAKKKRKGGGSTLLAALGGGVIGAAGMFLFVALAGPSALQIFRQLSLVELIVAVSLAAYLAIWAHELGHVFTGRAVGFEFQAVVVGPIRVERSQSSGGLRVRFNRDLALYGGIAITQPRGTENLALRFAAFAAGGPVTSLLIGASALLLVWLVSLPLPVMTFFGAFGVVSVLCGLATMLPVRNGPFKNDGLLVATMLLGRHRPATRRDLAVILLASQTRSGLRPADWDPALVENTATPSDGTLEECQARFMRYLHFLDRGQLPQAGAELALTAELAEGGPSIMLNPVRVEVAYFAALTGTPDPDVVSRAMQLCVPGSGVSELQQWRLKAMLAARAGDAAGMASAIERWKALPERDSFDLARQAEVEALLKATTVTASANVDALH